MTIKKKAVVAAVSKATKAKAESSSTQSQNWDKLLINGEETKDNTPSSKKYEHFNGKDRLVRTADGWGSAKGKKVEFVIYASLEDGTPCDDLPPTRFGSLSDVEYMERKYPLSKGYFVNDQLCSNGRHKINVYHIHITNVIDKVEEVE